MKEIMSQVEFFNVFSRIAHNYKWVEENGIIKGYITRGKHNGDIVNPVTAVARSLRRGYYHTTQTQLAAYSLGISQKLALAILSVCSDKKAINGHSTVVKGKLLKSLLLNEQANLILR